MAGDQGKAKTSPKPKPGGDKDGRLGKNRKPGDPKPGPKPKKKS